jgi:hypothetical protein
MKSHGYYPDDIHPLPIANLDVALKQYNTALQATTRAQQEGRVAGLVRFSTGTDAAYLKFYGRGVLPRLDGEIDDIDDSPFEFYVRPAEIDHELLLGHAEIGLPDKVTGVVREEKHRNVLLMAQDLGRIGLVGKLGLGHRVVRVTAFTLPFTEPSKSQPNHKTA